MSSLKVVQMIQILTLKFICLNMFTKVYVPAQWVKRLGFVQKLQGRFSAIGLLRYELNGVL